MAIKSKNDVLAYFSKKLNIPERFIINHYDNAVKLTSEFFNKNENQFTEKEYDYLVETMKNMIGLEEKTTLKFLNSKKTIKQFLEDGESQSPGVSSTTMVSQPIDQALGKNTITNKKDDDEEEDKDSEEEKQ